jgi:hypothetical protein
MITVNFREALNRGGVCRALTGCCLTLLVLAATLWPVRFVEAVQDDWLQGNRVKLRPGGFGGQTLITMEMGSGGDVWIRQETKEKDAVTAVTLLLIGGKAVAVSGGELPSGGELEILDRAGLQLQLVEHILARAYPDGPDTVQGHEKIALQEKKEPIRIGTTGSKGYFSPPWSVAGQATPLATDKIGFDLTFSFTPEKSTDKPKEKTKQKKAANKLKFAGIWQRDSRTPNFDDRLPLQGWKIYLLGTRTAEPAARYGAVPTEDYKTLGELRQALHKQP